MSIKDIVVTIQGGTQEARTLVAGLTTQVLESNGFDAVTNTVLDSESMTVPTSQHVTTILDMCKAAGSPIFNTPITIEDIGVDDDEQEDDDVDDQDE